MEKSILLVHYSGPPEIGGVERVLRGQARVLKRFGHPVGLAVGVGKPFESGIPVHVIPEMDSRHPTVRRVQEELQRGQVPTQFVILKAKLKERLTDLAGRYPIWIVHNIATMPQNLALTAAIRDLAEEGVIERLVLWHHDLAWGNPRYHWVVREEIPWVLLRHPWPKRVEHVAISEMRRGQIAELYGLPKERIRVIPNGIDAADFFRWRASTLRLIEEVDLLSADLILLQPVRITPRKNLEWALEIVHALKKISGWEIRLIVTGPPDRHREDGSAYWERLLEKRKQLGLEREVRFPCAERELANITREVVIDLYTLADGVLLTSDEEGFGLPVLEAGLARVPVFARYLPPLDEAGNGHVFFFQPEDPPEKIAQMILKELDADLPGRLRRRVRREFFWEAIYKRFLRPFLEEIVKR